MITFTFYFLVTKDHRFLRKDGSLTDDAKDENIYYGTGHHIYESGLFGNGAVDEFLTKSGITPQSQEKLFIGCFDYAKMFERNYDGMNPIIFYKNIDVEKMHFIIPD